MQLEISVTRGGEQNTYYYEYATTKRDDYSVTKLNNNFRGTRLLSPPKINSLFLRDQHINPGYTGSQKMIWTVDLLHT